MRDVVFLVADATMQQVLEGFFAREQFHRSLGCGPFAVDGRLNRDVFTAAGLNDPGLFRQGHDLLRVYQGQFRHAVVMLDADWDGSPGAAVIERELGQRLAAVWEPEHVVVIVPDPEIEAWFWLPNSPHVSDAMGYRGSRPYREVLAAAGHWPDDHAKPPRPKEALEYLHKPYGTDKSPAVRRRAAEKVSVHGCQDPAFHLLRTALRRWFPAEDR